MTVSFAASAPPSVPQPNGDSMTVRLLRLSLALTLLFACGLVRQIHAQAPQKSVPVFVNGQAQVVPAFADTTKWIRQELWVETEFDTDGDGKKDRMHVDVTRPGPTESEGLKVAVIFASSPYYSGTSLGRGNLWDVKQELGAEPKPRVHQPEIKFNPVNPRISSAEVRTWVPRGFAVVHSEAPGTGLSQGCPTVGDSPERLAPKAVIDWLNGRAKGYTTLTGNTEVSATSWSTGKVGMTGTSYEGTLPLAAAVTGVAGLEAIIPISPNTSYYHYYRTNGLVRSPAGYLGEDVDFLYDFVHSGDPAMRDYCNTHWRDGIFAAGRDRKSGDFNDFWASRDLLPLVKNVKAAVLLAHGFNDYNVVPEHSTRIYEALKKQKTPAMIYLHQGGHGGAPPLDVMNRWWSHYLYGVDNGVEKEPRALIVREGGGRGTPPTAYADFPNPAAAPVVLHPAAGGNGTGGLTLAAVKNRDPEKFTDNSELSVSDLAGATMSPSRLIYATPVLTDTVHLSGTATITIRLASSKAAANLTVALVTLPYSGANVGNGGHAGLLTRGWADPQNHESLKKGGNYDSKKPGKPLEPGKFVDLTFDLQPDDQIVPPGKRIGLVIMSSDKEHTLAPAPGTVLTVDINRTSIALPVVGGRAAYAKAAGN